MEELSGLGLTKNEQKTYETLIKFGVLSAGEVSIQSGVSYSRIYDVLASLVEKGLARVVPEKTKKFAPGDPEALMKLVEEKEKSLKKIREKISEMKQFYSVKEKNPVEMGIGQAAFYKLVSGMKEGKRYEYNIKWNADFKPDWVEDRKKKLRKGIDVKDLVRFDKETEKNVKQWVGVAPVLRRISNEGIAFSVVDDEEVMISLIKSNVTLLIKDKPFAKIMKKMFLETYKNAELISS